MYNNMKRVTIALSVLAILVLSGTFLAWNRHNAHFSPKTQPQATEKVVEAKSEPIQKPASVSPNSAEIYKLVNEERTKAGLSPLPKDPRLDASATKKANEMLSQSYFDHVNPTTGVHGYAYVWENWPDCPKPGENIVEAFTSSDAIRKWMNSAPHRAAILSTNDIAIGVGVAGQIEVLHFCQTQ